MPGTALWVSFFLFASLGAWHGSVGGRIHVSPFVSLYLVGCHGFMCGVFRGQAFVFESQKCVSERARALDQAAGSMLRMHA